MRTSRVMLAAASTAGAAGLAASYSAAGQRGIIITGTVLAVLALLAIRAGSPPAAGHHRARRPEPRGEVAATDFPAYRQIASDVGWAGSSRRHYDWIVRPRLSRLLSSVLAERYQLDVSRRPEDARRLVGEELWPHLDSSRPPSDDGQAPGVDLPTLARIVDLLEGL